MFVIISKARLVAIAHIELDDPFIQLALPKLLPQLLPGAGVTVAGLARLLLGFFSSTG